MKAKRLISILALFPMLFSGCADLDYNEISTSDEKWVYESPLYGVQKLVTNIYAHVDYDFGTINGAMCSSATDEADYAASLSDIHKFYNGGWSPVNPFSKIWSNSYSAIAEANTFLEKIDKISLEEYKHNTDGAGDVAYDKLKAKFEMFPYEVRFLRAYFYFELAKTYGDVPLVTKSLSNAEANSVDRSPVQDVFKFIVDECDAVAEFLPITFATEFSEETGRASRPMVLALKARALLYAASPLFNKSNDTGLWLKAAKANKEVIEKCEAWGIKLGNYADLWGDASFKNPEIIFYRPTGGNRNFEQANFPVGVENGNSGNCPTQTLVDAYEYVANGKTFGETWSASTVNVTVKAPFDGLDPRFGMSIVKNGDAWPSYNTKPIETFEGGLNGAPIYNSTPTGYYLRKYCDGTVNISTNNANTKRHSWIIFRLAEFYLNYAEAMFQYTGDADAKGDFGLSANQAVNAVRNREDVKMPDFKGNSNFIDRYERERMVEFAFEGHRFWDVRRWKKAATYFTSINIAAFTKENNEIILTRGSKARSWNDKQYLFPIPFSEMQINKNLTQNTGW